MIKRTRKLLYIPIVILALLAVPFDLVASLIYYAIEWMLDIAEEED
jgi:hypothetical protein